jgi:signal peptide peptidase SppA
MSEQSENTISLTPIADSGIDLEQYFGLWGVAEEQFVAMFGRVQQLNLAAHIQQNGAAQVEAAARPATNARTAEVTIGLVDINGTLMKRGTSLSRSSSLINLRRVVRNSARDPEIDAILLRIDSPGGTVAGTQELAEEVVKARQSKPVFAFVEDLAASAAYWIASQADRVYANTPTSLVGSIGTFVGLYDYSAYAAKEGIKAVVIKAGELKGAGFPGTEITEEQKAYWQEIVDGTQAEFTAAVAAGRGVKAERVAREWATGRVYMAGDAGAMGMIDGVKSFDAVIAELTERARGGAARSSSRSQKGQTMSEEQTTQSAETEGPKAATLAELKAACTGADSDFLVSQMEANATAAQAQGAWIAELSRRQEAAEKKAADAEEKAKKAEAKSALPGVESLGGETDGQAAFEGDPISAWNEAVKIKMEGGIKDKRRAMQAVVHEQPDLHQAYIEAVNAGRR